MLEINLRCCWQIFYTEKSHQQSGKVGNIMVLPPIFSNCHRHIDTNITPTNPIETMLVTKNSESFQVRLANWSILYAAYYVHIINVLYAAYKMVHITTSLQYKKLHTRIVRENLVLMIINRCFNIDIFHQLKPFILGINFGTQTIHCIQT